MCMASQTPTDPSTLTPEPWHLNPDPSTLIYMSTYNWSREASRSSRSRKPACSLYKTALYKDSIIQIQYYTKTVLYKDSIIQRQYYTKTVLYKKWLCSLKGTVCDSGKRLMIFEPNSQMTPLPSMLQKQRVDWLEWWLAWSNPLLVCFHSASERCSKLVSFLACTQKNGQLDACAAICWVWQRVYWIRMADYAFKWTQAYNR